MNYTVGFSEIWGAKARVDSLSDYFTRLMDGFGLVDIVSAVILPTWSNRRVGGENIYKRLDRLLISADLLDYNFHFRQWVGFGGDSDHYPVFLQTSNDDLRPRNPFKFNANWLVNDDLVSVLKDSWKVFDEISELSPSSQFAMNLKTIKYVSIDWLVKKKAQD